MFKNNRKYHLLQREIVGKQKEGISRLPALQGLNSSVVACLCRVDCWAILRTLYQNHKSKINLTFMQEKMFRIYYVQRNSPRSRKLNLSGSLIRRMRKDEGITQEQLAAKLQIAGWDIDRVVVTRIETGDRTLFDYELKFFLDVFGKSPKDIVWE